jgi:5-methylcytosine-specific restriction endonuclease McrA
MESFKLCPICKKNVPIIKRSGRGGKQAIYCSVNCRYKADWLRRGEARKKVKHSVTCLYCSISFKTARSHQKFCSEDCRRAIVPIQQSLKYRALNPEPINWNYSCDQCKKLVERSLSQGRVTSGQHGKFCKECAYKARSARNRKKNTKRRGIQPSSITVETLKQERGSNCALCLEAIDFDLPRTSRYGVTVDHIQPISLGGSDESTNLQLAHWICNNRKSNKVSEDLIA